jgi:hypothetical protein
MPIDVTWNNGRTTTANNSFVAWHHSGVADDAPPYIARRMDYAKLQRLEAGQDIFVFDGGEAKVTAVGGYPRKIRGHRLNRPASLTILNDGYRADRSFSVDETGTTEHGSTAHTTKVDGRVVEEGEFRPVVISWPQSVMRSEGPSRVRSDEGFSEFGMGMGDNLL